MKYKNRFSTATSHRAARSLFAIGAALTAFASPVLLTGCGSSGGTPDPSSSPSANQIVITGRIVDVNAGSTGVSGATVRFAGATAQTNANGNFSLTVARNTAPGVATITAPAGKELSNYASINTPVFSCANSPSFVVAGPLTGATFAIGDIFVFSKVDNAPAPPCI
jgi:hypothetical protein